MTELYLAILGIVGTIVSYIIHERRQRKELERRQHQMKMDFDEREKRADEKIAQNQLEAQRLIQDTARDALADAKEANKQLRDSLLRERETAIEVGNKQRLVEEVERKLISARRENDDLRTDISRLSKLQEKDAATLEALQKQVATLTFQLDGLRSVLNEKETLLAWNISERARLTEELNAASTSAKEYELRLEAQAQRITELEAQLAIQLRLNLDNNARILQLETTLQDMTPQSKAA